MHWPWFPCGICLTSHIQFRSLPRSLSVSHTLPSLLYRILSGPEKLIPHFESYLPWTVVDTKLIWDARATSNCAPQNFICQVCLRSAVKRNHPKKPHAKFLRPKQVTRKIFFFFSHNENKASKFPFSLTFTSIAIFILSHCLSNLCETEKNEKIRRKCRICEQKKNRL